MKILPRRPLRHQIGIGNEYTRRIRMRGDNADRLARLHEQSLVVTQLLQCVKNSGQSFTIARGLAGTAIHN